jgi:hypothetical protein
VILQGNADRQRIRPNSGLLRKKGTEAIPNPHFLIRVLEMPEYLQVSIFFTEISSGELSVNISLYYYGSMNPSLTVKQTLRSLYLMSIGRSKKRVDAIAEHS